MNKKQTITDYVNTNYREYAIYTLENRGIPSFYDSLTNVQRLILLNTPNRTTKTLSVVGECIKAGYHHGDSSLQNAINRLARPYNNSEQLLIGDGFFGTQINSRAASSRYTSILLNSSIESHLNKYKHLNGISEVENRYLNIDVPLGVLIPIIGIAVGYKTMILPRKLDDVIKFLNGKVKKVLPYFKNFNGKISKYEKMDNSWLIEGEVVVNDRSRTIDILSLPPLMTYRTFINKLNKNINEIDDIDLMNNSQDTINITIKYPKNYSDDEWVLFKDSIIKATKLIVRESIIFIKDGKVLEYECVEDYLLDFGIKNEFLYKKQMEYMLGIYSDELEYLKAKLEFLVWMEGNDINKLKEIDITNFLNKYNKRIQIKLDSIKLRKLNSEEIRNTKLEIKKNQELIEKEKNNIETQNKKIKTLNTKLHIKNNIENVLFEIEETQIENIDVFIPDNNDEY